jgi:outer membrane lipoprotein-sorting protein
MRSRRSFILAVFVALILLPGKALFAADDLQSVLHKLDVAAAGFHSTSADFEFDSITTEPISDKDVQKGTVYYERKGKSFAMAAHILEENGHPDPKMYMYSKGVFQLYEEKINQVTRFSKLGKYSSWFMLGFGASGEELADKWNIAYLGSETLDGVRTDKLQLIPKDPAVLRNLPKVTIWIDSERGVTLKQVFDEGPGQYRVCVYFNIKVNQSLPRNAFTLKTNKETQFVNR